MLFEVDGNRVVIHHVKGNDALAWVDDAGDTVPQSQLRILQMARCQADTPALPRPPEHHDRVRKAVEQIVAEDSLVGGQLGRPSGLGPRPTSGSSTTPRRYVAPCWTCPSW